MSRCDSQDEEDDTPQYMGCNKKCVPAFGTGGACITRRGVVEDFIPPPPVLEHFDCPACDGDSEEDSDDSDDSDEDGGGRGRRKRRRRGGRGRGRGRSGRSRAKRDAARYQPWTPYYLSTVLLEKLAALAALFMYIYSDNYRWGLFKSFIFFTYSVKSMFTLADHIQKECERRQRCLDLNTFYSK